MIDADLSTAIQGVPWSVSAGPNGFVISLRGSDTGGARVAVAEAASTSQSASSASASVAPPGSRMLATFSAVANKLFAAGRAEGLNPGLWRYDLSARTWEPALHKAGSLPDDELVDMTYDPDRNVVYLLSLTDGSNIPGIPRWITLIAYDIAQDRSSTLASWRQSHNCRAAYITLLDGGDLAVTTTTEQNHAVCRFTPAHGTLALRGVHRNGGSVPLAPVVGDRELIVPVQKGNDSPIQLQPVTKYPASAPCVEF